MKNFIKSIIAIAALMLGSTGAWADNVVTIIQLNGETSNTGGTVTIDKPNATAGKVTITTKPNEGYYLDPADVTVIKTIPGSAAQTREPGFDTPLEVTHASGDDITGEATYTFEIPETGDQSVSYGAEVTVNFRTRTAITDATVSATGTFAYTGEAIVPETITVKLGDKPLTVTTDYTLKIEDNTDPGDATITATGVGKYKGTATGNFTINPATIDAVTLDKTELTYTGAEQTVSVTTVMAGTLELTEEDYEVSGNKGTNADTYTVTVTAKEGSNFTGSKTAQFTIGQATIDAVTLDKTELTYTGAEQTVSVTKVMAGTIELTADDYEVSGNKGTNADTYTVTVTAKEGSNFTGSKTAQFTIGQATITEVTLDNTTLDYTGAEQTVSVTKVMAGTIELTADDYEVSGNKATDAGTYTVKVTAKEGGNFKGEATAQFTIEEAPEPELFTIDAVTLDKTELTYTGAEQTVSVTKVMAGTIELTADDYEVSGNKGTNADTYTVTVTAKEGSNFTGSKTAQFTIGQATITEVTLDNTTLDYTGAEQTVSVTKVMAGTIELTADDYEVSGNKATDAGTYTVKVTAKEGGNFKGEATADFTIEEAPEPELFTIDAVTLDKTELTYTGAEQTVSVTKVMAGTVELTADDYEVSGNKATNAGTYTVTVTAKEGSNFTGSKTAQFTIGQATITEVMLDNTTLDYTGAEQTVSVTKVMAGTIELTADDYEVSGNKATDAGTYTVKVTAKEGGNFKGEATAQFTINQVQGEGYGLWVGGIQVTDDNWEDILGDGKQAFTFNSENNTLLITNNLDETIEIESRLDKLNIFLNGEKGNKLKKIYYNNLGNAENTGSLYFTAYNNTQVPSTVAIKNTTGESAISGFKEIEYNEKSKVTIIAEGSAKYAYKNGKMYKTITDDNGTTTESIADELTIGQVLSPMDNTVSFTLLTLQVVDENGQKLYNDDGTPKMQNLENAIVSDVLITLPNSNNDDSDEGLHLDDGDNRTGIAIETATMKDSKVRDIAKRVRNNELTPGGHDFAKEFVGMTILLPAGSGIIKTDLITDRGYEFHGLIAENDNSNPFYIKQGYQETEFYVSQTTYCYIYLVDVRNMVGTRLGKREKAHGKVYSLGVDVKSAAPSTSPSEASGGALSPKDDPVLHIVTPTPPYTGISTVENDQNFANDGKWYTIDGQQITQPTKKGIYIQNGKKVVIK